MLESRLIFVEGLPGSGKSTTARHIVTHLQADGRAAELIAETQADHPLNVGGALHPAGRTTGDELFRRYTVDTYLAESALRWEVFVARARDTSVVSVVDSYPYQNLARVLLQMDCPTDTIRGYVRQVEAMTQSLAPALVHLSSSPGAEALAAVWDTRGEEWKAYVVGVATACPYAVHRRLAGITGALAVLDAYDALIHQLLDDSSVPRLELEHCAEGWPACYERLAAFLGQSRYS